MKRFLAGLTLIVAILFVFSSCEEITNALGLNSTPVANAGEDQTVDFGVEVTLNGSGSSDADGDSLTYSWTLNSYPSAAGPNDALIAGATNAIAQVTPKVAGTYVFDLEVSDEYGSSSDSVTIIVLAQVAPATPTGLTVGGATESTLTVSWNASDGADDYTVYRDTSSTGAFSASVYSGSATSFTDTGLFSGVTYWYMVMASNDTGDSALSSAVSGTTTAEATEAPSTPANLTASSVSSSSVTLTWDLASGATSYQLERSDDGSTWPGTYIYNDAANTHIDTTVSSGTTYYYRVIATNSVDSSVASAAIQVTTDLAVPTGLTVDTPTQSSLTISWTSVTGADGYALARSDDNGLTYTDISAPATNSYVDSTLASGTTYYYKVKATNSTTSAESSYSSAKAGLTKPATPTAPTVGSATESSLTISWTAVTGATKYYVYSDKTTSGTFSDLEYSGSDTAFTDSGLTVSTTSTTYNYQVRAWNSSGYSGYSTTGTGDTLAAASTAPDQPTGLAVDSSTSSSLTISWTAAANAAEYLVYSDSASPGSGTYTNVGTTVFTEFTETNLSAETTYTYYVVASNSVDTSANSATVTGTTDIAVPATPTAPTVIQSTTDPTGSLDVSFSTVAGADSYTLYRSTSTEATTFSDLGLTLTGTTTVSYSDAGLYEGTTYYYKVQAFNSAGGSNLSTYGYATTGSTITVPTGLQVSDPTVSSLTISWTDTGADQYRLFSDMSEFGEFTYLVYEGTGTTFTETGLDPDTPYYYKVKAVVGNAVSDFSAVALGTTLAQLPATPTGLTVGGASATSLYVSWNESPGAAEYTLSSDAGQILYNGSNTFYTHDQLTPETTYGYRVLATNSAGSSPFSGIAYGTTTAAEPPAPASTTATALSNSTIEVTWTEVTEADFYKIYRQREDNAAGFLIEVPSSQLSLTDDKLASGTTYTYAVKAGNMYGDSPLSPAAAATTLGPPAPYDIWTYNATAYSIEVAWNTVEGVTGYNLYRTTTPDIGTSWTNIGPVYEEWFIDTGLMPDTEYFYRVTSFVETQESTSSPTTAEFTTIEPTTLPPDPSFWPESVLSDSITLRWDQNADADYYNIYESPGDVINGPTGAWTKLNTEPIYGNTFIIDGLTAETTYWYAVTAVNSVGESSTNNWNEFTTPPIPPAAPTVAPGIYLWDVGTDWVNISWDDLMWDSGDPADPYDPDVQYYILQRSEDGGATWTDIYTGPNTWFDDYDLAPGIYDYQVAGANSVGTGPFSSMLSVEVSGTGGVIIIVE